MSISKEIKELENKKPQSKSWYRSVLEEKLSNFNWQGSDNDIDTKSINPNGSVYYFSYQAEYPQNYPYYDRYPMAYIININPGKGFFLGANLHYLHPEERADVAKILINKGGEWRGLVPTKCLHTYLILNCGTLYRVPPSEWVELSKLPTQDFRDSNGRYVSDSKIWSGNR